MRDRNISERGIGQLPPARWLLDEPVTPACALMGNGNGDLVVHGSRLNPLSHIGLEETVFLFYMNTLNYRLCEAEIV